MLFEVLEIFDKKKINNTASFLLNYKSIPFPIFLKGVKSILVPCI